MAKAIIDIDAPEEWFPKEFLEEVMSKFPETEIEPLYRYTAGISKYRFFLKDAIHAYAIGLIHAPYIKKATNRD